VARESHPLRVLGETFVMALVAWLGLVGLTALVGILERRVFRLEREVIHLQKRWRQES
jgi:hypothetical protein